jgi:hypothetical protein
VNSSKVYLVLKLIKKADLLTPFRGLLISARVIRVF